MITIKQANEIENAKSTQEPTKNYVFGNNTGTNVDIFRDQIIHSVKTLEPLPEEIDDCFELTILLAYNPDGSNRGILNWA